MADRGMKDGFPARTRSAEVNKGFPGKTRGAGVAGRSAGPTPKGKPLANKKGLPRGKS